MIQRVGLILVLAALAVALPATRNTSSAAGEAAVRLYLPLVADRPVAKGLAAADWSYPQDLAALKVDWYYGWSEACPPADDRCVNMVRHWQMPRACYPLLMAGNEPDLSATFGQPAGPPFAAAQVRDIEQMCPTTRLIVGNISHWGRDWLKAFLYEYARLAGRPFGQTVGVHCYAWGVPDACLEALPALRAAYDGPMWLTEFNCLYCTTGGLRQMLAPITASFERYAIYTNRQPATAYDEGWGLRGADLVNDDDSLVAAGQAYADWAPSE